MSTYEYLKATVTTLHGSEDFTTKQILAAFAPIIGDPDDLDEYEGEIEWFSFSRKVEGSHWPTTVNVWEPIKWKDGKWALKYTLAHSRDYDDDPLCITVAELNKITEKAHDLASRAGFSPGQTYLTSYSWYNGTDAPEVHRIKPFELPEDQP